MTLELQPVIFAAGEGSKMFPLTEEIPKCLLPVGNMPMIWYVVNYLEKYGFKEIIVVVRSIDAEKIFKFLQLVFGENLIFDFVKIPEEEDECGTADSLRRVKDKIKNDVLILSCDMFTDAPLNRLVDIHRIYSASLTIMVAKRVDLQTNHDDILASKTKRTDTYSGTRDFISIEPTENRLLYFANEGDLEKDVVTIKKSCLKRYPFMKINTDLVDCHLYIMKKWLLEYLANYSKPENIKSDFIPHVVQKQFSKQQRNTTAKKTAKPVPDIYSYVPVDEVTKCLKLWSGYQGHCLNDQIKCHAYITDKFCLRVNTLSAYSLMNRQIIKMKDMLPLDFINIHQSVTQNGKTQIGNDCLIGESTISNNVTVVKSIIGKNCTIGSNTRLSNCIIMDGVTINDKCILQDCIVCSGTTIQSNVKLTKCQVSSNQVIPENSKLEDETIVQEEVDFDD